MRISTVYHSPVVLSLSYPPLLWYCSSSPSSVHPAIETRLVVDSSRAETLRINCSLMSHFLLLHAQFSNLMQSMDISGEQHLDVKHDIVKKRLDAHGNVIEVRPDGIGILTIEKPLQRHCVRLMINVASCNSCEDVRDAYRNKGRALPNPDMIDQIQLPESLHVDSQEGRGNCFSKISAREKVFFRRLRMKRVKGVTYVSLEVNKLSHKINRLAFGDSFPGVMNLLMEPIGTYQYFMKVVPTIYSDVSRHTIESYQFSVTEHYKGADIGFLETATGVFFTYDLYPIKVGFSYMYKGKAFLSQVVSIPSPGNLVSLYFTFVLNVTFSDHHVSFLHFLTNVCAIVGGNGPFALHC
ncbi:hypothetical protein F3Y22_tig00117005pilonHSYRG00356 [Hibiscus syriacus]|uniref:Endoplasmic reticulum vesicle transporter C-terminal domain-containing protein n=1 Tax=Hibiscus syriacus TaxID=106335 RepID=A0A6A2WFG7_HIBSY|nr:hypothetical protein F3Y22_tig00117005pilonHSYRG00356 [Hibiscus syriacus]